MPYYEPRLSLELENFSSMEKYFKLCEILGMKNLIVELNKSPKNLEPDLIDKIRMLTKLNLNFRFNLKPVNMNQFKKDLKIYNNFPFILSIETPVKDIQIQAAKDSRIDVLSYSNPDIMKTISPGVISLIKQSGSFIEFSVAPIMVNNRTYQSKNFRLLYRFIQLIMKIKPNYIISGNFGNPYDLRHPRNLSSICHTLLGMPLRKAKEGFSKNVELLLNQVKIRSEKNHFQSGVRLIRGE